MWIRDTWCYNPLPSPPYMRYHSLFPHLGSANPRGPCDRTRASGAQGRAAEGEDRGTRVGGDLRDGSGATVGIAPSPSRVHDGDEEFRCVGLIHFTSVASQCSSIETMKLLRVFFVVNSQF
jgi:hypothetical protein